MQVYFYSTFQWQEYSKGFTEAKGTEDWSTKEYNRQTIKKRKHLERL